MKSATLTAEVLPTARQNHDRLAVPLRSQPHSHAARRNLVHRNRDPELLWAPVALKVPSRDTMGHPDACPRAYTGRRPPWRSRRRRCHRCNIHPYRSGDEALERLQRPADRAHRWHAQRCSARRPCPRATAVASTSCNVPRWRRTGERPSVWPLYASVYVPQRKVARCCVSVLLRSPLPPNASLPCLAHRGEGLYSSSASRSSVVARSRYLCCTCCLQQDTRLIKSRAEVSCRARINSRRRRVSSLMSFMPSFFYVYLFRQPTKFASAIGIRPMDGRSKTHNQ